MAPLLFERTQDWCSVPTWWLTVPNYLRPFSVPCRHQARTWRRHIPIDKPTHKIKIHKIKNIFLKISIFPRRNCEACLLTAHCNWGQTIASARGKGTDWWGMDRPELIGRHADSLASTAATEDAHSAPQKCSLGSSNVMSGRWAVVPLWPYALQTLIQPQQPPKVRGLGSPGLHFPCASPSPPAGTPRKAGQFSE